MPRTRIAVFPALLMVLVSAPATHAADCAEEAAALMKDESELPRVDVAPPGHRAILCITLETIIAFAARLKAHVAHCPQSDYAASAADWEKKRTTYAKRFAQRRCRRTLAKGGWPWQT